MTRIALGHRIDRWLVKNGDRNNWLLPALKLVTARRVASAPIKKMKSYRAARSVVARSQKAQFIPRDQGYQVFSPDAFPELPSIVDSCQSVYDDHLANLTGSESYNKSFFYNILTADGLHRHPVLLDFSLSQAVTEIVTGYLGHLPRLNSLGVFYSPINDTVEGSQRYHIDGDCLTQVKVFINAWEASKDGGGFTFVPKSRVTPSLRAGGLNYQLKDDDVSQIVPMEQQIVLEGMPGSGAFIDTSRCLHQGSRARTSPRLVFQLQYVSRPDALLPRPPGRSAHGGHRMIDRSLLKGFDLSNPNAEMFVR